MRSIQAEALTRDSFADFGQFVSLDKPEGLSLNGSLHRFFPDRLCAYGGKNIGFSSILVKKPQRYLIEQVECHTTTWEMLLPLSGDMLLHVSPKSGAAPRTELTRAFIVPKNTLIRLDAAVWHLAPLPINAETLTALIVLPECTYMNDCRVVDLREEEKYELIL